MGSSLIVISLALLTLLAGIAVAAYQLWSADQSQQKGNHSALAARYGGKPVSTTPQRSAPDDLAPNRTTQEISQADFGA